MVPRLVLSRFAPALASARRPVAALPRHAFMGIRRYATADTEQHTVCALS